MQVKFKKTTIVDGVLIHAGRVVPAKKEAVERLRIFGTEFDVVYESPDGDEEKEIEPKVISQTILKAKK